jgi:hypothetical protein
VLARRYVTIPVIPGTLPSYTCARQKTCRSRTDSVVTATFYDADVGKRARRLHPSESWSNRILGTSAPRIARPLQPPKIRHRSTVNYDTQVDRQTEWDDPASWMTQNTARTAKARRKDTVARCKLLNLSYYTKHTTVTYRCLHKRRRTLDYASLINKIRDPRRDMTWDADWKKR